MEDATYHSSGQFTLDPHQEKRQLGQLALEEPALAVLWLVQTAVALGVEAIALRLSSNAVSLRLRSSGPLPESLPSPCDRLSEMWSNPVRIDRGYSWTRKVPSRQVSREAQLLHERARFCPVPLKLDGYIVQPEQVGDQVAKAERGNVPAHYHLAELYLGRTSGNPGLSLFRPDAQQRGYRINTGTTFYRECEPEVTSLEWHMPWRVAGQVARLKPCSGYRCSAAALLLVQSGQPSRAVAVAGGVVVDQRKLEWPELPGLLLIFEADGLPTDLSRLRLVDGAGLAQRLQELRERVASWVQQRCAGWTLEGRQNNVTARQNRREMGAWLSVWGAGLLTGTAMYLPLPLLALPWIVWHQRSRKQIFADWRARLAELGVGATEQK